jgi:hypothetical protein
MQTELMDMFRRVGRPINITGDGQYDSPGFSASYCFYSIVETTTNKMLDFYVATKNMTEYSAKMEPLATKILLTRLHKQKIEIGVITTDRSNLLKKLLKEINNGRAKRGLPHMKHSYDVWHMVKSVSRDIYKASKLKNCQVLALWNRSVSNMLWYALAESKGNVELLREMILSIPKHVAGIHSFPENKYFTRCLHGELHARRNKAWLRKGSLAMKKLVLAIRGINDSRLKDIEMMTEFQHTGSNEQINNLHNLYLPKSCSFGHKQAIVRAALTAIDHNSNVNRKPALDKDGEERFNVVNSRDGQVWTAKIVKEPKNTKWRNEIVEEVMLAVQGRKTPYIEIPTDDHLKIYGKKIPKPDKSDAIAATKANRRFRDDKS